MPLLPLSAVIGRPNKGWAVGAFDTVNLEMSRAIFAAAELEDAPLIVMVYPKVFTEQGKALAAVIRSLAEDTRLPVALHLDHATDANMVAKALRYGFTSVMIDGSSLPFANNVEVTKTVVSLAHACGVDVEAEIGHVPDYGEEIGSRQLTGVEEAKTFVEATGVDALAVSIGNMHSAAGKKIDVNLDLLHDLRATLDIPLVVHGGSGLAEETAALLAKNGVDKINFFTSIWRIYFQVLHEATNEDHLFDEPYAVLAKAMDAAVDALRVKIRSCGCHGRL